MDDVGDGKPSDREAMEAWAADPSSRDWWDSQFHPEPPNYFYPQAAPCIAEMERPCSVLLDDFGAVMADKTKRPNHMCRGTAWRSTDRWLEQSGIARKAGSMDDLRACFAFMWPRWPLDVGRADLDDLFGPMPGGPDTVPIRAAIVESIRSGLPFDGNARALLAVRFAVNDQLVEFFGLQDPTRVTGIYAGESVTVWRGARLWDRPSPASELLRHADEWWDGTIRGQRIQRGGRPRGSGQFPNGAALREQLDPIVAYLKRQGQRPTETRVCKLLDNHATADRVLRRWVRDLLQMRWDQYIETVPAS